MFTFQAKLNAPPRSSGCHGLKALCALLVAAFALWRRLANPPTQTHSQSKSASFAKRILVRRFRSWISLLQTTLSPARAWRWTTTTRPAAFSTSPSRSRRQARAGRGPDRGAKGDARRRRALFHRRPSSCGGSRRRGRRPRLWRPGLQCGRADDRLREEDCRANVIHVAPTRSMLTDGLAQYLIWKQWRRWLLVVGSHPEDQLLAEAYRRSAKKFGAKSSRSACTRTRAAAGARISAACKFSGKCRSSHKMRLITTSLWRQTKARFLPAFSRIAPGLPGRSSAPQGCGR